MKNELMIDIETTGTSAGCKVLSLGAYGISKTGEEVEFYRQFDVEKMDADGLRDDESTMKFWEKQGQEAINEAFSGKTDPATGIGEFKHWFITNFSTDYADRFRVWSCGTDFDFPILKYFFAQYGYGELWPFWTQFDYRTLKNIFHRIKADEKNVLKHTALEDAKAQMRGLQSFYRRLKNEFNIMLDQRNLTPDFDIDTLLGAH